MCFFFSLILVYLHSHYRGKYTKRTYFYILLLLSSLFFFFLLQVKNNACLLFSCICISLLNAARYKQTERGLKLPANENISRVVSFYKVSSSIRFLVYPSDRANTAESRLIGHGDKETKKHEHVSHEHLSRQ